MNKKRTAHPCLILAVAGALTLLVPGFSHAAECGGEMLLGMNVENQSGKNCEFTFEASPKHYLTVHVSDRESEAFSPQVTLLDPDGQKVASGQERSGGSSIQRHGPLRGGTYTIRVVPNDGWQGKFLVVGEDLGLDPRMAAYDPPCTAGTITAGQKTPEIEVGDSYCEISYQGTAGKRISIAASGGVSVILKVLYNGVVQAKGVDQISSLTLAAGGAYTIVVKAQSGDEGETSLLLTEN